MRPGLKPNGSPALWDVQKVLRDKAYYTKGFLDGLDGLDGTLTLAWFAGDRAVPVQVLSSEVLTPRVRPGDKLIIRQRILYLRDCAVHVDRALYDHADPGRSPEITDTHREWLRDIDYDHPPLGLGKRTITFEEDVPLNFRPGPAEYRALPSYSCNPLQKYYWPITRPETIIQFEVAGD